MEDPYQLENLADSADARETQATLEQELQRQLDKIDDPFREGDYYLDKWGYEVNQTGEVPYSR